MDPVPYRIREDDIDEVLNAHGTAMTDEERERARDHVMKRVTDLDEIVRSAPEEPVSGSRADEPRAGPTSAQPGDREPQRRGMALAAIEDVLIRDGFLETTGGKRVFPAVADPHATRGE